MPMSHPAALTTLGGTDGSASASLSGSLPHGTLPSSPHPPMMSAYSSPHTTMVSPTALLPLLPEISRFDGDDLSDRGAFQDWIEQFESVASLGRWDDHYKLVNLTARLRGAAYSFYRSCTPAQRSDYRLLV